MAIDVHAHFIPRGFIDALEAASGKLGVEVIADGDAIGASIVGGKDFGTLRADLFDIDHRLEAMAESGVDTQVLSSWIDLTAYSLDAATGAAYSRTFNEALADVVRENPDRFMGLANVPLQAPERAAEELAYAMGDLGLVGVEIATTVDGEDLDLPALDAFWEAAEELGCFILLHPFNPLAGRGLSRYFLDNSVGRPAETTIAIGHMIYGGVFERFPRLVVCLVHGGGFLPYQIGRLDKAYSEKPGLAAANLSRPPSQWARRLYYDTVTHDPEVLSFLVDRVGADHVLTGTDYPFEMGDADPVATVRGVPGLSEEDQELILSGNAGPLLGRP
jgi:aminocarboxymuconate-semialdehyde decarboxylase